MNAAPSTFEEHFDRYGRPEYLTSLLQNSVPLLKHLGWYVTDVEDGYCRSVLPAAQVSTNQHHALQGSTYLLAGDYTGGIALATLFPGLPTFGVHPVKEGFGNNIWLSHANLKYAAPTYDDLAVSCRVERDQYDMFQRRFWQGQRVVARVELEFLSNGKRTMRGSTTTYFSQKIHYDEWLTRMEAGKEAYAGRSDKKIAWPRWGRVRKAAKARRLWFG